MRRGRVVGLGFGFVLLAAMAAAGPRDAADLESERRLEAAIVDAARERWGLELRTETALQGAARELSTVRSSGLDVDPHEFLRGGLSQSGVLDPYPYVFYGTAPSGRIDAFASRFLAGFESLSRRERRLYTHVAVGIVTRSTRHRVLFHQRTAYLTVVMTQRSLSFTPLPEEIQPGERVVFEGEVHAPFRNPEILLTRPRGDVVTLDNLASDARGFRTWVRFDAGPGEYQLEVVGRDDMGPRVLGLCSLYAGADRTSSSHARMMLAARQGTLAAPAAQRQPRFEARNVAEAEARLLELVARDRRRAGVPALAPDAALAAMARAHSRDMAENDFFAHISPQTGRLAERAGRAAIRYQRLAENIAMHRFVDEAEAALLRSPGHRANLLDPEFTHIGVGVAFATDPDGNRRIYVTQNFMIPVP